MYKPPENSNRVLAMKLKFESQDSKSDQHKEHIQPKNTKCSELKNILNKNERPKIEKTIITKSNSTNSDNKLSSQILNRQLSDPAKRNIKRTPAFRLDKNAFITKEHAFHRQASQNNIKTKLDKFKSLHDSSRLKENCDNENTSAVNKKTLSTTNSVDKIKIKFDERNFKEMQTNSADNNLNNSSNTPINQSDNSIVDIAMINPPLYAEPIPKSIRTKQHDKTLANNVQRESIYNTKTLKVTNLNVKSDKCNKIETAQNVIEILKDIGVQNKSTDTITKALKRPLPKGPAPKKPPRTFQHSPQSKLKLSQGSSSKSETNISTLNLEKSFTKKLNRNLQQQITESKDKQDTKQEESRSKRDPKYMLDKLENALKNNRIKLQKQAKVDYTSDEDFEESCAKPKCKSSCSSPLLKKLNNCSVLSGTNQIFNLNCLPSLSCSKMTYTRIKEPNSNFFVDSKDDEPVYAEPFQYQPIEKAEESLNEAAILNGEKRNSLYYMSSPVLDFERELKLSAMDTSDAKERNNFGETSSISTLSSDSDSNISPAEGNNSMSNNIKHLIKSFEARTTLENDSRSPYATPRRKVRNEPKLSPQEKLEELQNHLKGTLERCQSTNEPSTKRNGVYESERRASDVDEKKLRSVTSKFEIYVEAAKVFSIRNMNKKHLFHCCLLVGLDGQHPYIKSKFPTDVEVPAHIEKFCFPDSEDHRINYSAKQQCYSLVITDESGDRIYGYCRRVLPEGSTCCLPLAYCILTKHRAPRFYKKILEELESHHGRPDKQRENLINEFYKLEFPKPGHSVRLDLENIILNDIKYFGAEVRNDHVHNNNVENRKSNDSDTLNTYEVISHFCSHGLLKSVDKENEEKRIGVCTTCTKGTTELVLTLHQDVRYEETDLKKLCETLDVAVLQKVFENLLLEKKVIFASCHLSKLSSCIEAIQSVLYPFSWPHAFIPVLPKTRWEIVEAPAPLICGVLSSSVVNDYTIEDAIVVDLDTNEILLESDDGMKVLPDSSVKSWRKGLQLANSIPTSDNEHNVLLSDAFIRVFINTCGHYKEFISNGMFDKDGFKDFPKGKGTKRFLRWFTETTMFYLFIEAVLGNPDSFYIFDSRIKIYSSQDATLILEKMRDWKKL